MAGYEEPSEPSRLVRQRRSAQAGAVGATGDYRDPALSSHFGPAMGTAGGDPGPSGGLRLSG